LYTHYGSARLSAILAPRKEVRLDDQALANNAHRGDIGAFEELVRRHQESAFRASYLVLRDAAEAEDAVQEAFVKAYKAIGRFREDSAFRPWLLKIVVNQSLTMLKSRRRRATTAERAAVAEGPPPAPDFDDEIISRERAGITWRAIAALRENERVIVYLRYFLALPEHELAQYLGCPPGTVKSRLHRALKHLREVVVRDYPQLLEEPA
jgi:RNA polymerase sigma-70 factor (ECF subfamily)